MNQANHLYLQIEMILFSFLYFPLVFQFICLFSFYFFFFSMGFFMWFSKYFPLVLKLSWFSFCVSIKPNCTWTIQWRKKTYLAQMRALLLFIHSWNRKHYKQDQKSCGKAKSSDEFSHFFFFLCVFIFSSIYSSINSIELERKMLWAWKKLKIWIYT